jgi:hypothetical protein
MPALPAAPPVMETLTDGAALETVVVPPWVPAPVEPVRPTPAAPTAYVNVCPPVTATVIVE